MHDHEAARRRLLDSLSEDYLIYRHGKDGVLTYIAPSVTKLLGYDPEECLAHYHEYLTDHPANAAAAESTARCLQGRRQPPYEVEIRHKNGGRRWFEVFEHPFFASTGEVVGLDGIARDITDRKLSELALRESQALLEEIINAIPVRVFWKNRELKYLGCNTAFAKDAGYAAPADMIGKDDTLMVWREQAHLYRADDRQVIESGRPKLPHRGASNHAGRQNHFPAHEQNPAEKRRGRGHRRARHLHGHHRAQKGPSGTRGPSETRVPHDDGRRRRP